MDVTENELAGAFETIRLDAMNENSDLGQLSSAAIAARLVYALPGARAGSVVDARICCDCCHDGDRELSAMADVVQLMSRAEIDPYAVVRALYPLDGPELHRVLRWFTARYPGPGSLPS